MALVDYKNAVLNSFKLAQEQTTPVLVLDQIAAYGENSSGDVVWLSDFQDITWKTPVNGIMNMNNSNILLDIQEAGTLYGFKIISSEGLDLVVPSLEDPVTTGLNVNIPNKTVSSDDFIKITDAMLGVAN